MSSRTRRRTQDMGFPQHTYVIPGVLSSFPQHTYVIPGVLSSFHATHPRHSRVGGNLDARYCGIR